jgi:hypothetical protein
MLRRTGFARKVYTPAPPVPLRPVHCRATYDARPALVLVPKRVYVRSPELLAAVRTLPCQITGRTGGTEPAHSNWGWGKGRGIKADDNRLAALHFTLHRDLDQGSKLTRAERQELWWLAHCRTIRELLRRGLWPAGVPVPDIRSFDA